MATKKKMLQAAAGQAGGAGLDITDVFSTYLYEGTGSAQTINNGIDLDGEGGLVWIKARNANSYHSLWDTERGTNRAVFSHLTNAESNFGSNTLTSFNSNGFSSGSSGLINDSAENYASWTFRKAPKFFTCVTWTGDGNASKTISHSLGSTPGFFVCKPLNQTGGWRCFHRSTGNDAYGQLNENYEFSLSGNIEAWAQTSPTDTNFTVGISNNTNNINYVAYLFAHNDGDGEFGPDGDQDIIKCGSYTGVGSGAVDVDLGFEPQFVLVKNASIASDWMLQDTMRGMSHTGWNPLVPNKSQAELVTTENRVVPTATGFTINNNGGNDFGQSGNTVIYMAIRRGPLAQPESGTEVFQPVLNGPIQSAGFPVDFTLSTTQASQPNYTFTRMTGIGTYLATNSTNAEAGTGLSSGYDNNTGIDLTNWYGGRTDIINWMFRRAPSFCDVVAYSGSTSTQNISHNLGVQPEMIWIKNRSFSGTSWPVLFTSLGARKYLNLNTADAATTLPLFNGTDFFANTLPTSSVFTVGGGTAGGGYDDVGSSGSNFIAYLFATLPGVSKVGSYTGTGATLNIDCGFTSGARFVLIKRTNNQSPWWLWDSERGIVAGNDPYLELNSTAAENTSTDYIDPYASGFALNSNGNWLYGMNYPSGEYIFYAIA